METTKLSSKGQIIIPKNVRVRRHLKPGQEFDVIETPEGILLRPIKPFPPARLEDLGRSLNYRGPAVPVDLLSIDRIPYEEDDDGA